MRSGSGRDGSGSGGRACPTRISVAARWLGMLVLSALTAVAVVAGVTGLSAQAAEQPATESPGPQPPPAQARPGGAVGAGPAEAPTPPQASGSPEAAPQAQVAPAAPAPSNATVVEMRGQVAWRQAGTEVWQKAEPGLTLGPGDEILTWDGAYVVLQTGEGHRVELGPRTQVRVAKLQAARGAGQKGGSTRLRLWLGKIWSTVTELLGTESRYEVETGSAVAAVRGTDFYVETGADGSTWVVVQAGEVEVEAAGQRVTVPAGHGVQVASGQPPGQPQPTAYPTPPSAEPPEEVQPERPEPPPATPTPPPQPPQPPAAGGVRGRIPATLETLNLRDISVLSLGLNPELHFGPWGVSLDLRIYYTPKQDRLGLLLDRQKGEIIDEWSEVRAEHLLQLIRWIEYDTPGFGARWGRLDPVTVGEGILVSGYRMGDHTGARLRADLGFGGGMVVVPTNPTTRLVAGRLFVRPARPSPLQVGLQAAVERPVPGDQGLTVHDMPGRTPPGPVQGYGVDVVYPFGLATAYVQGATLAAPQAQGGSTRWGASAGLAGAWGVLAWRAEYRLGRGFAFGYFDGLYETWAGERGEPSRLDLPAHDAPVSGYRLQADLTIPLIAGLGLGGFYENYEGQNDRIGLHASLRLPDSLEASVSYLQSPVDPSSGFRLDAPTALLTADVRYPVRPGVYVILRRVHSFGAAGQPSLSVTTEFTL